MKEAAGEANLTVVAIILIAVVVAVATPLISSLMKSSGKKACCTDAGGKWQSNKCVAPKDGNGKEIPGVYGSASYEACIKGATVNDTAN